MKIIVTGGAGFIGSNFVKFILEYTNCELVIIDKMTYAADINNVKCYLDNMSTRCKLYIKDICDKDAIETIFENEKPDLVINFAAESHVDNSINNPDIFLKTNILGTSTLMQCCIKYGNIRFHQVSTDEVYGDLPLDRPDLLFDENYPLKTSSPYSSSKAAADLLVMSFYRTYKLPVSISRCSNNYGPNQNIEKLIPKTITKLRNKEHIGIYGKGLNVRDWLYVEDHCNAIWKIVNSENTIGEIYNIGGNNEKTNIEIVKIILKELKLDESYIDYIEDRKGHDLRYAINSSKIQKDLKWKPLTSFKDGIIQTINYYINKKE